MEAKAISKYARISPQKCRLIADSVRGQRVIDALVNLQFSRKSGAVIVEKAVRSAVANATSLYSIDEGELWIKGIYVNKSFTLKRWFPRAKGRATPKLKRNCHISVTVGDKQ